eukprot:15479895-Alexandrium_andersonii.AAC.1
MGARPVQVFQQASLELWVGERQAVAAAATPQHAEPSLGAGPPGAFGKFGVARASGPSTGAPPGR